MKAIRYLGPGGRTKAMSDGVVAMLKAFGISISINNDSIEEDVHQGIVEKERDELASKVVKLEGDLSTCKEKHGKEVEDKYGQIKALTEQGTTDLQIIKEQAEKVKSLEEAYAPGESERDDLKFLNCAALIEMLDTAEGDLTALARETFENALAQVQVANSGMQIVTDGLHFMKEVVDGVVVTPPYFDQMMAGLLEGAARVGGSQSEGDGKAGDPEVL